MPMSTTSGVLDWSRRPEVPRPPGRSSSGLLQEARPQALRRVLEVGEVLLEQLAVGHVGGRGGHLAGDAVLEAGHAGEPARAPLAELPAPGGLHLELHRERDVDVDRGAHLDPVEAGRGHPDDGHRVVV